MCIRDSIREWRLEFAKSQRVVENREKCRKLAAKSSVVPQRPSRLRDRWDEMRNCLKMNDVKFIHIMNQPSNSTLWKVYLLVCFSFFHDFCFTKPNKQPVYRESQGRKLTAQSKLKETPLTALGSRQREALISASRVSHCGVAGTDRVEKNCTLHMQFIHNWYRKLICFPGKSCIWDIYCLGYLIFSMTNCCKKF